MDTTWILVADSKLCIVAPPKFLGLLRQHLRREVQKLLAVTSAKDVAWLDARSIAEYIGENLQPT